MTGPIALAPFAAAHLDGAVALSRQAGWPHRRADWELVAGLSQGVVALEDGAVVGTALCTPFGGQAMLNMIIVEAGRRGRGLGRRLMEAVIALAGDRGMTLTATADGAPLYARFGFAPAGTVAQHQGIAGAPPAPGVAVRPGGPADLPRVLAWDRDATGMDRAALLARLAAAGQLFVAAEGYAVRRAFGRGEVIGPVVARDAATARALVAGAAVPGRFLRVDTDPALGLGPWLGGLGLTRAGGGTVMRRGPAPAPPGAFAVYGLAAQALG